MNRQAKEKLKRRHKLERREMDIAITRRVPCSLATKGTHLVTIGMAVDGTIVHLEHQCKEDLSIDAIDRLGGDACIKDSVGIRQKLKDKDDDSKGVIEDCEQMKSIMDNASREAHKRRQKRARWHTDGPSYDRDSRFARYSRIMTAQARTATKLQDIRVGFNDGSWYLTYDGDVVARRGLSQFGWTFDDEYVTQVVRGNYEPFAEDHTGEVDSYTKGNNKYCTACRKLMGHRSGHVRTGKHIERMRQLFRTVMVMFPGPRRQS